ncbi:MAG TPA: hypothetical protein VHG52_07115, partial [Thermomicrobiales bacterium]|nr:hypothetical protein [Thermomicrobiales bacterium]
PVQATDGPPPGFANDVVPGAADFAGTIRKALTRTALVPAQVLAFVARLRRRVPRGGPKERTGDQGAPGCAPGPCDPEEAGQSVESLLVHRVDPP